MTKLTDHLSLLQQHLPTSNIMKVFTLVLTIGAAAIGISGVMAKAVPQEGSCALCFLEYGRPPVLIVLPAVELPVSLLNAALANREVDTEGKSPAHLLLPCWRVADDSFHCPVIKRDADGGMLSGTHTCTLSPQSLRLMKETSWRISTLTLIVDRSLFLEHRRQGVLSRELLHTSSWHIEDQTLMLRCRTATASLVISSP